MVNLTRIYTRLGDDGGTHLSDMSRVPKTDLRLQAYADCDEANAALGVAIAQGGLDSDVVEVVTKVQNDLFDVGADLSTPVVEEPKFPPLRISQVYVDRLEQWCDQYLARLEPLRSFVLPGGTIGAALLHQARTILRRAERSTWAALEAHGETMHPLPAAYLNRASDLLFIVARVANTGPGGTGDVLWVQGRSATESSTSSTATSITDTTAESTPGAPASEGGAPGADGPSA